MEAVSRGTRVPLWGPGYKQHPPAQLAFYDAKMAGVCVCKEMRRGKRIWAEREREGEGNVRE